MKKLYLITPVLITILQSVSISNVNSQVSCSGYLQHYWKLEENNLNTFHDYAGALNANVGVMPTRVLGIVDSAQYFNGLAEASLPDDNSFNWSASSSFSIEFWMNKSSACPASTGENNNVIIGRDDPATQLHWWAGISCTDPGHINFNLIATNGSGQNLVSKQGVIDGLWHHIAIIRNGTLGTTSIYIDGTMDTTISYAYTGDFASSVPVNIGWLNLTTKYHYNGSLDELALYNRAITSTEILEHYNSGNGISYCAKPTEPNTNPVIRILPLGNSITFDDYSGDVRPASQRVSYRLALYNKLSGAGYNFDFVGSEAAGQDFFPDPENGGFPGINKEQMVTLLQTGYNPRSSTQEVTGPYLDFFQPDVILLHIGTNDLTTSITAIEQLLDIIDQYRTQSGKDVKLLIARIINRKTYSSVTTEYNNNLEAAVAAQNNPNNYLVDMENGAGIVYATDMIDNLHPNSLGYEKMAALWFNTLTNILPEPVNCPESLKGYWSLDEDDATVFHDHISGYNATSTALPTMVSGKINKAALFDGTSSQANIDNGALFNWSAASNFSLQFWIKKDVSCNSTANNVIIGRDDIGTQLHWWVGIECSSGNQGKISFNLTANNGQNQVLTSSTGIIDNNWHLVTISRNGLTGNTSLYIDNGLEASGNITFTGSFTSSVPVNIGWLNISPYYYLNGTLDELALYDVALGINEIQSIYNAASNGLSYCQQTFISPPSNLNSTAAQGEISLSWTDNSSNESGFRIERETGSGTFVQIAQPAANIATYTDNTVLAATSYTYRVYAYNSAGSSAYSNESTATTPAGTSITNLAPGKTASQSTTAYGGVASRANDDNTNGDWANNSVAHTNNELNPWWQVDLQASYLIDHVVVWNRTNSCCMDRLVNYYIFVSDVPFTSTTLSTTLNQAGVWSSLNTGYPNPSTTIPVNQTGRYVRIQLAGQGELNLAELQVFGGSGSGPVVTIPNAPASLTTVAVSSGNIQLTWADNASDENGFRIERETGSGTFVQIAQPAANIATYTDNTVLAATSYTYRVYAYNSAGSSAYSNESTATTPAGTSITNLAPGKTASQSTTAFGGVASRANDDNTNGDWANNSVAHTNNELNPWWQVDLLASYLIDHVVVWNRTNSCCMDRLVNYYIFVSDVPFTSTTLSTTLNQAGVWSSLNTGYPNPSTTIPVNQTGRYVRIQLAGQGELNLAELQVFGGSGSGPVVTIPNAPASLTTVAVSSGNIQLTWADNASDENGFRIERETGSGTFVQIAQPAANIATYTDNTVLAATSYTYRVYAYNSAGSSAYSNESTATTPAGTSITNLAPGKTASQSTTAFGGVASRANDDNTNGDWANNSVAHTNNELNPWWQVDLLASYLIDHVVVWNRTNSCCMDRLVNYYIFVSDVPFTSTTLSTTLNQAGVWSSLNTGYPNPSTTIPVNQTGRYVRIQLAGQGELNLAELQVFGGVLKSTKRLIDDVTENENIGLSVFPNPFYSEVTVQFNLSSETRCSLKVYDITGKELKNMVDGVLPAGSNLFNWNGTATNEQQVGPGVYLIRLIVGNNVYIQKAVIAGQQ